MPARRSPEASGASKPGPEHDSGMNLELLKTEYDKSLAALAEARADLVAAQKRTALAEQRVSMLRNLLAIEAEQSSENSLDVRKPENLIDVAVDIISDNGGAMRLAELRRDLLNRGIPLPGKGTDANLLGRLQRSGGRVVRVDRGLYAVAHND